MVSMFDGLLETNGVGCSATDVSPVAHAIAADFQQTFLERDGTTFDAFLRLLASLTSNDFCFRDGTIVS